MNDSTSGIFTTAKLETLLEHEWVPGIRTRQDVARALSRDESNISSYGVYAWFRRTDSNYHLERKTLSPTGRSYAIPKRRWAKLLTIFGLTKVDLERTDDAFRSWVVKWSARRDDELRRPGRPLRAPGLIGEHISSAIRHEASTTNHPLFLDGSRSESRPELRSRMKLAVANNYLRLEQYAESMFAAELALKSLPDHQTCFEHAIAWTTLARAEIELMRFNSAKHSTEQAVFSASLIGDGDLISQAKQTRLALAFAEGQMQQFDVVMRNELRSDAASPQPDRIALLMLRCALNGETVRVRELCEWALDAPDGQQHLNRLNDVAGAYGRALVAESGFETVAQWIIRAAKDTRSSDLPLELLTEFGYGSFIERKSQAGPVVDADQQLGGEDGTGFRSGLRAVTHNCIKAELAIDRYDLKTLRYAYDQLDEAFQSGLRFTFGWPFCVPHVLARAAATLGYSDATSHYLEESYLLCREVAVTDEMRSIRATEHEVLESSPATTATEPATGGF